MPASGCQPGLAVSVGLNLAGNVEEGTVEAEEEDVGVSVAVDDVAVDTHKALFHSQSPFS